jgi:sarcosine oxidase subunit alpha
VRLYADLLAVEGGWSPAVHLTAHLGSRPAWSETHGAFLPGSLPPGMTVAGAAAGDAALAQCLATGASLGLAAAVACGRAGSLPAIPETDAETGEAGGPATALPAALATGRGKVFLDQQHDVTTKDVALAHREGYRAPEHMKRYTTLGMATDQGKTSSMSGLAALAQQTGHSIAETGTTTFRPPFTPVAIGTLAGHHRGRAFRPTRRTPTHAWARDEGAVFVESGAWLRAQWFPRAGERDWLESVNREVGAVRTGVGLADVSTLGKIDVQGSDAARLLDLVYANTMSSLAVGRVRYGLMLREDGFVMDDGTVARLGPERYVLTTTTANAAKVLAHLEHSAQWLLPEADVAITPVTEQWAQIALAGPRSRDVLARIVDPGADVGEAALPHQAVRELRVLDRVGARVFRISYSGERAYEIAVPAHHGEQLVRALMAAGRDHAITPYGTEAMGVMRIEKGHVAGNELNGQTTARDLGLERMVAKAKDCIGKVMAERPALVAEDRPRLVGLKPVDRNARLRAGAHLVAAGATTPGPADDQGHVTSVAFSPSLGHWIGLGLLAGGLTRKGEPIRAFDPVRNGDVEVEVCDPVFVDPEGARLHG